MATTALQSRTPPIAVPSIHLGAFSPYPTMSHDLKHPVRAPDAAAAVFRDDPSAPYPPRTSPQWRPNGAAYPPPQAYPYAPFVGARGSYAPAPAAMPRTSPPPPASPYPPALPAAPPHSPAAPAPPREVCVECMMRDEDMADVDVTSPGVWERASDAHYRALCEDDERECAASSAASSSASEQPRARGGAHLTEGNLKLWLSLNPREPAAKLQTLHLYLDAQNALLAAEARARGAALQEARQLDDRMRDAYAQLRRSAYDLGASASARGDDGGVRIRSPSADDLRHHRRDTTLLENGMIVERVDVRKEEARLRKEGRRARKASRDSLGAAAAAADAATADAASLYSYRAAEGGAASLRAPYESSLPTSRSVRSMFTTPSTSWQQQLPSRPMSMAPSSGGALPAFGSQTSLDSASPRRRFLGLKHYFGSNTSLAPSGSMIDMHLGLDQDRHLALAPHVDIGSNAPSLREAWLRTEDGAAAAAAARERAASPTRGKKKKRHGLGRLWKMISGAPHKSEERARADRSAPREVEDEDLPLAPPPPLSYLVNRSSSAQPERAMGMAAGRHLSMSSLPSLSPQHPRSGSVPSGVGLSVSSPSEKSSTLPSPIELRFSYRDSSGDEREEDDGGDAAFKKGGGGGGGSPPRALIANVSEPDFRRLSLTAVPGGGGARTHGPPSSTSLTPTIKVPPVRPASVMSLDKTLPPLPPGEHAPPRPQQHATLPLGAYAPGPPAMRAAEEAARRQSFGGLASRPALPHGARPAVPSMAYDEFGAGGAAALGGSGGESARRRSRFGLGALLGRKDSAGSGGVGRKRSCDALTAASERSSLRVLDEAAVAGAVAQDADFVAYRYPSRDERLNLSARG